MTKNITESLAQMIEKGNEGLPLKSDVVKVGFKRLSDTAVIPTRAHESDSGFDLVANEDVIIEPGETKVIPTGIAVNLPAGYEAQVRPRSGVTAKTKLRVQLGTIDNGYTGEVGVIVDNIAQDFNVRSRRYFTIGGKMEEAPPTTEYSTYLIRKGEKIAQLVVQHLPQINAEEVHNLGETKRGDAGFGSTGI